MLKKDEVKDPNSCLNKAADDEMVFVLRGKDMAAPETIRAWIRLRIAMGLDLSESEKILDAEECVRAMEDYQRRRMGD